MPSKYDSDPTGDSEKGVRIALELKKSSTPSKCDKDTTGESERFWSGCETEKKIMPSKCESDSTGDSERGFGVTVEIEKKIRMLSKCDSDSTDDSYSTNDTERLLDWLWNWEKQNAK